MVNASSSQRDSLLVIPQLITCLIISRNATNIPYVSMKNTQSTVTNTISNMFAIITTVSELLVKLYKNNIE